MNTVDKDYQLLLKDILDNGVLKHTRSGDVISVFDRSIKIDMRNGFPLLTTKKMFTKGFVHEILWMLSGSTNIKYLVENGVHIWDADAYRWYCELKSKHDKINSQQPFLYSKEEFIQHCLDETTLMLNKEPGIAFIYKCGDLGPVYGKQWRSFGTDKSIDQISTIIDTLKNNPNDRRLLCSAWAPNELSDMALPPCHYGFQLYARPLSLNERLEWAKYNIRDNIPDVNDVGLLGFCSCHKVPEYELSLKWTQRSCDFFLGVPFNIGGYGLLLHLIARCVNMTVGTLSGSFGDCHIYTSHIDAVKEQLQNDPLKYNLPKLVLNPSIRNIDMFRYGDISFDGYESFPKINAPLSVG